VVANVRLKDVGKFFVQGVEDGFTAMLIGIRLYPSRSLPTNLPFLQGTPKASSAKSYCVYGNNSNMFEDPNPPTLYGDISMYTSIHDRIQSCTSRLTTQWHKSSPPSSRDKISLPARFLKFFKEALAPAGNAISSCPIGHFIINKATSFLIISPS
jgi:hypothetical protein